MRKLSLTIVSVLTIAGCSQMLGLGEYDIDPALDGAGGSRIGAGGADGIGGDPSGSPGGNPGGAGDTASGGQPPVGEGGAPGGGQPGGGQPGGGQPGGGQPGGGQPSGGEPPSGAAGEGGEGPVSPICKSLKCCQDLGGTAVPTDLVPHGDFEGAPVDWDVTVEDIFTEETPDTIAAHSGEWFAWLGGVTDDVSFLLSPVFTVPRDTGWLTLETYGWFKFDSAAMTGDYAELVLYPEGSDDYAELFFSWDNAEYNTGAWDFFSADIPVATYASKRFQIGVYSVTDALADDPEDQEVSNFFFDDLTFTAYACKL